MVAEAMEEYALASAEASEKNPGEHAPMVLMDTGGVFNDGNASHWWDQTRPLISKPDLIREH